MLPSPYSPAFLLSWLSRSAAHGLIKRSLLHALLLPALTLSCLPLSSQAETIKVPILQQAPDKQAIERPAQGATEAQVLARFGEPQSRSAPTGKPPITQWQYPDFVVFFDTGRVIHSVLKPKHK